MCGYEELQHIKTNCVFDICLYNFIYSIQSIDPLIIFSCMSFEQYINKIQL